MRKSLILVLVVLSIGILSCQKNLKIELIDQIKRASDYKEVFKKWTQEAKHFHVKDVEFFINTTFKSLELRMAYLKEYCKKFKIPLKEQKEMYEKEISEYENSNDFFITVFSSKKDVNDLSDSKKWRLYLFDGDVTANRIEPQSIKKVKQDSVLEYFYPYVTAWTSNYDVKFSKVLNDSTEDKVAFSTLSLLLATLGGEKTFTFGVEK